MERRNTKQRQIILDAVRSRCDHPSAEQIYTQVKAIDPKISMGTVYRNLAVLNEEGQIQEVQTQGADTFDLITEKHNHLVCEKCGKVFDIDVEYDVKLDNQSTKKGFVIQSHQTIFKGLCPKCAKDIKEAEK